MRLLIPCAVVAALLWPLAAVAEGSGTLTVTGMATVNAVPDQATLSLGVTTTAQTAAAAMAANNEAASAVIARLIAAKVADLSLIHI
jgi:uncharacterized protein YggE